MKRRVLIVEDEIIVADDLEHQLSHLGYEVVGAAGSGEEAVLLAHEERPDVVLMDMRLQGAMSGAEAAKIIQRNTGAAIIFVTAFPTVFLRDPAQMTAPGICLSKPFSPVQLKVALDSVAPESRAENQ
ncbi:MAG TPA: response regulator [Bryobacteraceae bacterium]|jgi:CheY-like chemotaxis protein|nr:response regulator [Bryobacteraceae bacterium]